MFYKHETADTGQSISNLFGRYFVSTFNDPGVVESVESVIAAGSLVDSGVSIGSVMVSPEAVLKLLKSLDLSKSGGPDNIPPIFITSCADSLLTPICILFERSLTEGLVPSIWKSAFVTPIFKKGDKTLAENYRPISKLCLFAKILEKLVYDQVYGALRCSFSDVQHGFLKGRSTVSNLALANDFITAGMEKRAQVDVIYTDYSKCFDRIDHFVLRSKISLAGIHGDLFRWFSSYIDNRSQAVVLSGYTSTWAPIPSGVPQGSLLGPLLFTIFIMDIKECFHKSKIILFADDMKILKVVRYPSDVEDLQADLQRFENYCSINKLDLNVSKCFYMSFTRCHKIIDSKYTLKDQVLLKVHKIRDLGIIHDDKLIFDKHVDYIVKKSLQALGFILRSSSNFRNMKTLKVLYCAYVRSHLEYASQVWNPQYDIYIKRIERVQRKFLKYLDFKFRQYNTDYYHRCNKYHFLPLETRRMTNDVCYLINIANGNVDCPDLLSQISLRTNTLRLRQRSALIVPPAKTKYRANTFTIRACKSFNLLPCDIDLFCSSASLVKEIICSNFFTDSKQ